MRPDAPWARVSPRAEAAHAREEVVVVGGSLGGVVLCESLRQGGFCGAITAVDQEPDPHFDRPPLTKEYLAGDWSEAQVRLRTQSQLDALEVTWRLGTAARALDVEQRELTLADGGRLSFDHLVIATGAQARFPAPLRAPNAIAVRSMVDGRRLRALLDGACRLVVVGAGFLGLEVAATATKLGVASTVVEALGSPLGRVMPPVVGEAVRRVHERAGVTLRCGVRVLPYGGEDPVDVVDLEDGVSLPADVIVVAVGSEPCTAWLEGSTLKVDDGIVCDDHLRAAPGIWVIGDVARWPHPRAARHVRVEHWTNAVEQARYVARAIVDRDAVPAFSTVPYFWSHQHGTNIQAFGFPEAADAVRVVEGDLESPRFVAALGRNGALTAVVAVDMPKALVLWRRRLVAGVSFEEAAAS